jgi:PPOX class probable F420-dependent enzyme
MASSATLDELPAWARALIADARVGHLGMVDDRGRPRVLPVTFAVVDASVWSAVDDKPKRRSGEALARVRWLRARPAATLTVDRYDEDWTKLAWVQLLGETHVVDPAGRGDVLEALAERYPHYRSRPPARAPNAGGGRRAVCWRADDGG